jgi:hypothetical protein
MMEDDWHIDLETIQKLQDKYKNQDFPLFMDTLPSKINKYRFDLIRFISFKILWKIIHILKRLIVFCMMNTLLRKELWVLKSSFYKETKKKKSLCIVI